MSPIFCLENILISPFLIELINRDWSFPFTHSYALFLAPSLRLGVLSRVSDSDLL